MSNKAKFYVAKVLTIAIVSIYYAILGSFFSILIDKSMRDFDPNKPVPKSRLADLGADAIVVLESGATMALIGMSYYLIRKIVKTMLPQPFEGVGGFKTSLLRELSGGIIIAFVIFQFQIKLQTRLRYLYKKYGKSMPLY
jgi:hypothetical protein